MTDAKAINPANDTAAPREKVRIPMSVPQRRLEVTPIPGYHLHWFTEELVPSAIQAGYEFADDTEVSLNQTAIGADKDIKGNSDLGTRVRVAFGTSAKNTTEVLTLMKLREEFWLEDQKKIEAKNASMMSAIFRDEQILGSEKVAPEDQGSRYVSTALFNRPTRKAKK